MGVSLPTMTTKYAGDGGEWPDPIPEAGPGAGKEYAEGEDALPPSGILVVFQVRFPRQEVGVIEEFVDVIGNGDGE